MFWPARPTIRKRSFYAEIDLAEIVQARLDFDVVGHYARPDVFRLDRRRDAPGTVGRSSLESNRAGPAGERST